MLSLLNFKAEVLVTKPQVTLLWSNLFHLIVSLPTPGPSGKRIFQIFSFLNMHDPSAYPPET